MKVSYRSIAKLLTYGMPLDGQDYKVKIESCIKSIEAMPVEQQATLKASYIFSRKPHGLPIEERRDLFQDLVSSCLTVLATKRPIRDPEPFCYKTVRLAWLDRRRYSNRPIETLTREAHRLNSPVIDSNGQETELQELIAGEVEFERKLNSELDSQAVLNALPDRVKDVAIKRLSGLDVSNADYKAAKRYITKHQNSIREALKA